MTGEQGGPDVVPPYAAYAPPGTPQVGLGYPLPTAVAQLPLVPTSAAPILTPRAVEAKCLNWSSAPYPEFTRFHSALLLLLPIT